MDLIKRMSDEELVNNLLTGSRQEQAVKNLYRDHYHSLSRYILNNNGNEQDAEDIFQEVIVGFISLVKEDNQPQTAEAGE